MYYIEKPGTLSQVPEMGHCVIEASAGTGKTFMIQQLVLDLILRGCKIGEFLVVTFTREATRELRKRIFDRLNAFCEEYDAAVANGQGEPRVDEGKSYWICESRHRELVNHALGHFYEAQICTLDSLTQRILRENPDKTQMSGDAQVVMNMSSEQAFSHFMRECVPDDPLLLALVYSYKRYEPLPIEPFSSGRYRLNAELLKKDLDDVSRNRCNEIARPFENNSGDENILSDTVQFFNDYRTTYMSLLEWVKKEGISSQEAICDILLEKTYPSDKKSTTGEKKVSTPTAGDQKILNEVYQHLECGDELGWLSVAHVLSDSSKSCHFLIREKGVGPRSVSNEEKIKRLRKGLGSSNALERDVCKLVLYSFNRKYFMAEYACEKYRHYLGQTKSQRCQFTPEDFMLSLKDSLKNMDGVENSGLIQRVQKRWKIVIVDEFQDTSAEQWEILRSFFMNSSSGTRMFLIGDPKQAIYGFRGCDVFIYRSALEEICRSRGDEGWKPISLHHNYRSSGPMIDVFNRLYESPSPLFSHREGEEKKENHYEVVEAGHPTWRCVDAGGTPIDALVNVEVPDEKAWAVEVAREIRALLGCSDGSGRRIPSAFCEEGGARHPMQRIFVLARRHKDFALLRTELCKAGIAYAETSKNDNPFLLPENLDLLRIMCAIGSPNDDRKVSAALNTIFFGMPVRDVDIQMTSSKVRDCFKRWAGMARDRGQFHALFDDLFETTQFEARLHVFSYTREPFDNVRKMADVLVDHALCEELDWDSLVEWMIEMAQNTEDCPELPKSETTSCVQLMTIHGSKGLQADAVFLLYPPKTSSAPLRFDQVYHEYEVNTHSWKTLYCTSKDDPGQYKAKVEALLEEERLLYVALTRAKFRLYLPVYPLDEKALGTDDDININLQKTLRMRFGEPCAASHSCGEVEKGVLGTQGEISEAVARSHVLYCGLQTGERLTGLDEEVRRRLGRMNLSYSRLKREAASVGEDRFDWSVKAPVPVQDGLPGGSHTGLFLHEILERIDFQDIKEIRQYIKEIREQGCVDKEWFQHDECEAVVSVNRLFEHIGKKYKIMGEGALSKAKRIVYEVLTSEGHAFLRPDEGLCDVDGHLTELEFLSNSEGIEGVDKGQYRAFDMFNGSIDCAYHIDNVWYIVDWKSDTLADYSPAFLREYVMREYGVQLGIYRSVMKKWLNRFDPVPDFGGMVYVFLRGVGHTQGAGFVFFGPDGEDMG